MKPSHKSLLNEILLTTPSVIFFDCKCHAHEVDISIGSRDNSKSDLLSSLRMKKGLLSLSWRED